MSASRWIVRHRTALGAATLAAAVAGGGYTYQKTSTVTPPPPPHLPIAYVKRDESTNRIIPPSFPRSRTRAEQLAELRRSSVNHHDNRRGSAGAPSLAGTEDGEEYDLLIIGGGATGTGIALDAVTRGLKVALVERDDFSAGTSSKSTKLVHGGVRYLEKAVWNLDYAQLQLVMEALRERKSFLTIAPHLSGSLPILLPLAHWWQAPYMWIGTKMYDLLAGSQRLESSYYLGKAKSLEMCPLLNKDRLVGSLVYYDGQHNDARMNVGIAMTAAAYGATVLNHVEVTSLVKEGGDNGKICGAKVRDLQPFSSSSSSSTSSSNSTEEFTVRAKGVINATGPFADAIERMDDPSRKPIVAPSSGAHIVLPKRICPNGMGMLDAATSDGRVIFVLPWHGLTLAGTTDNPCDVLEQNPVPRSSDVDFIIRETNKLLKPDSLLTREDVLASWSGIRPLVKDPNAKNTESLVRSHLVTVSESGLLTCAGGKWTTYRQMAEEAVDEAIKTFNLVPKPRQLPDVSGAGLPTFSTDGSSTCHTRFVRLIGSHGYTASLPSQLREVYDIDQDIAEHLVDNYGDRAWAVLACTSSSSSSSSSYSSPTVARLVPQLPFLEAEIIYSTREEMARTAVDALARRTRLSFLDVNGALTALPRVIELMGAELAWDRARRDAEYRSSVQFLGSMGLAQAENETSLTEASAERKHDAVLVATTTTSAAVEAGSSLVSEVTA